MYGKQWQHQQSGLKPCLQPFAEQPHQDQAGNSECNPPWRIEYIGNIKAQQGNSSNHDTFAH